MVSKRGKIRLVGDRDPETDYGKSGEKMTINQASLEYIICDWPKVSKDPRGYTVEFAFLASGQTLSDAVWYAGSWEPGAVKPYSARVLVGPSGTVALASGTYTVACRLTTDEEKPVRNVGILTVD